MELFLAGKKRFALMEIRFFFEEKRRKKRLSFNFMTAVFSIVLNVFSFVSSVEELGHFYAAGVELPV